MYSLFICYFQINLINKDNNIDLSVKTIFDKMQNTRCKLSTLESAVDSSDKVSNIT